MFTLHRDFFILLLWLGIRFAAFHSFSPIVDISLCRDSFYPFCHVPSCFRHLGRNLGHPRHGSLPLATRDFTVKVQLFTLASVNIFNRGHPGLKCVHCCLGQTSDLAPHSKWHSKCAFPELRQVLHTAQFAMIWWNLISFLVLNMNQWRMWRENKKWQANGHICFDSYNTWLWYNKYIKWWTRQMLLPVTGITKYTCTCFHVCHSASDGRWWHIVIINNWSIFTQWAMAFLETDGFAYAGDIWCFNCTTWRCTGLVGVDFKRKIHLSG